MFPVRPFFVPRCARVVPASGVGWGAPGMLGVRATFHSSPSVPHVGRMAEGHPDLFFTGTGTPAIFTLTEKSVLLVVK